jgi:hypothetical protein
LAGFDLFSLPDEKAPHLTPGLYDVEVDRIIVPLNRRKFRGEVDLTESIRDVGLLNPITITCSLRLVAGLKRLDAARALGWSTVPCRVVALGELQAKLAEIDENVVRNELSALERADLLKRRKEIYETAHPDARHGVLGGKVRQGSASEIISFAADAAAKTGLNERTVQMDVKLAVDLDDEAKDILRGTPVADNQSALKALAREHRPVQRAAARKLQSGSAGSVREAILEARQEQPSTEVTPTDEVGSRLPNRADLRQAFEARPLFARVLHLQSRLSAALKALWEEGGSGIACIERARSEVESLYSEAEILIRGCQPHALCPACKGIGNACGPCDGRGWMPHAVWEEHTVTEEAGATSPSRRDSRNVSATVAELKLG